MDEAGGSGGKDAPVKWTVMVFMGADGVEGNQSLLKQAQRNIQQLASVGSSATLNILIQLHHGTSAVRYRVKTGHLEESPVEDADANPTDGTALTKFIEWAIDKVDHTPRDRSLLILWGHAYRFGIGHRATESGIDSLDFAELAEVLKCFQQAMREKLKKKYQVDETPKLDIVGFDACDLATVEMAVQLEPFANYLLASQIAVPAPGWPYDKLFDRIHTPAGLGLMRPAELGAYIVRRYCDAYPAGEQVVSLTLLDLRQAGEVARRAERLARRLVISIGDDVEEEEVVLELFTRSRTAGGKPYVDVVDLCINLISHSSDDQVIGAARSLGNFLVSPKPVTKKDDEPCERRPFVVEHGCNACEAARLRGVSLYAPHVADGHDEGAASHFYEKFTFAKASLWCELVRALALPC